LTEAPKEPREPEKPSWAAQVFVGAFASALARIFFEQFVAKNYFNSLLCALLVLALIIVALNLRKILSKSPEIVGSLNRVAADARWWVLLIVAIFLVVGLFPIIDKYGWPTTLIVSQKIASPEDIAAAVARALPLPRNDAATSTADQIADAVIRKLPAPKDAASLSADQVADAVARKLSVLSVCPGRC
jgi:hypothetical protein